MYGNYYEDAVRTLESVFRVNNTFCISSFHSPLFNQGIVESCKVTPLASEDSDRSNVLLSVRFKEYIQDDKGAFTYTSSTREFIIFNPEGDTRWTRRMKLSVWDNNYPDTVAIDRESGDVYVLYLGTESAEFKHFSSIPVDELNTVLMALDYNAPFYIFIDDKAMFSVLDGGEGFNHLLHNTYIMLTGTNRVRIDFREIKSKEGTNALSDIEVEC